MISANWGSATNIGLVRRHNEDAVYAQLPVFVVADGMGGHAAGEVASALTADEIRQVATGTRPLTIEAVTQAVERANRRVLDTAQEAERLVGMGTTVVGLALVRDHEQDFWLVFNVGDSRLYRCSDGALSQITADHSEVQNLIDKGTITVESAKQHPGRNAITRAVGIDSSIEPDFWLLPPVPGERFLLCSDGLTGEVPDAVIEELLRDESDPTTAATRLVEQALAAGGHDNVSVVVVDVLAGSPDEDFDTAPRRGAPVIAVPQDKVRDPDQGPHDAPAASPEVIENVPGHESGGTDPRLADGSQEKAAPTASLIDGVPIDGDEATTGQDDLPTSS